ncbi:MAG TPA: c-type cytochrome [Usitatibacter sp.]|nr:c-type cytochrome [Usitatibacter sp.]
MKAIRASIFVTATLIGASVGIANAAEKGAKVDRGEGEFRNSCALCHGADGKGQSAIMDLLKTAPPDLTTLAKRNGGVFPVDRVYAVIDGREAIKAHGTRDMPAWGDRYTASSEGAKAAEHYVDVPYDMEMYARARILSLIDYLNRIQVK